MDFATEHLTDTMNTNRVNNLRGKIRRKKQKKYQI